MEALIKFLSSIPATAWSALASAILTSTIAFLGISYSNKENLKRMKSQHEHERQLRKDEILRERAEELYVVVKKFCSTMISDHFPYVRVMKGHFSYNDALDMTIKSGEKQSYDPNRMHMIADIYFPELSEHIKSLVILNGEVLSFRDKYKHKYNSGLHKDEKTAAEYLVEIDKLIAAAKALEAEVASAVKRV